jgi:regulator of sigma E protease
MLGEDGDVEIKRLRESGMTTDEIETAMEGAFNRRPIWVRVVVLLAGVAMNYPACVALFAAAFSLPTLVGEGPLTVTDIQPGSPAAANLRVDDVIVSVDGRTFDRSSDLTAYVADRAGETGRPPGRPRRPIDGRQRHTAHPHRRAAQQRGGTHRLRVRPGAGRRGAIDGHRTVRRHCARCIGHLDPGDPDPGGLAEAVGGLIGLNDSAPDARGPIGIAQETGRVLEAPLVSQLFFIGLLSVNLAVLNVLPFPPLDGGRIAVVLVEAVRRRRMPAEREALIYFTGSPCSSPSSS